MKKQTDIIDTIAIEAKRLHLGIKLPEGDLDLNDIVRVRDQFRLLLNAGPVTMRSLSKSMGRGYSVSTLCSFRDCDCESTKPGFNVQRVARGVNNFLEMLARRAESKARFSDGFVETRVAQRMLTVIDRAIQLQSIAVVYGDAGRGKTMTLKAAKAIHTGSVLVRVTRSTRSPRGLAFAIYDKLKLKGNRTLYRTQQRLLQQLKDTGRPLFFDEAHQISNTGLELLRDIHDETGCPIILCGTIAIRDRIADEHTFFGQFASRVSLWYDIAADLHCDGGGNPKPLHSIEEIRAMYENDRVRFSSDAMELLTRIANLPGLGALRLVGRIVQVAAAASGGETITARLIYQVVRTMRGGTIAAESIEQALSVSRVKVA